MRKVALEEHFTTPGLRLVAESHVLISLLLLPFSMQYISGRKTIKFQ